MTRKYTCQVYEYLSETYRFFFILESFSNELSSTWRILCLKLYFIIIESRKELLHVVWYTLFYIFFILMNKQRRQLDVPSVYFVTTFCRTRKINATPWGFFSKEINNRKFSNVIKVFSSKLLSSLFMTL